MSQKPFFSVIIPLFNKAERIKNTLQSVLCQKFKYFEICLIDDGSTDGSLEIVSRFDDARLRIIKQKHSGVSAARNRGVKEAKGQFLAFLDADDEWYADYLLTMHQMITQHNQVRVFATALNMNYRGRLLTLNYRIRGTEPKEVNYFGTSFGRTLLSSSSVVMRTEVFNSLGGFDETLIQGEDTDFWIRLGLRYSLVFHPVPKACYHYSDNHFLPKKLQEPWVDFLEKYKQQTSKKEVLSFLNENYYSTFLKAKIYRQQTLCKTVKTKIQKHKLTFKQHLLMILPTSFLIFLVRLYNWSASKGLLNSVLK